MRRPGGTGASAAWAGRYRQSDLFTEREEVALDYTVTHSESA
jgi:hypothetical protein